MFPLSVNATTFGTCGDNLTWVLENGVLTISGTGNMDNYISPWGIYGIHKIVIENGVTSIGANAFQFCDLTELSIGNSVTTIGDSAFYECWLLRELTIPASVTTIGDSAFEGCTSLTQLTIPDGVTTIGDSAFEGCTHLTQLTIPKSVTYIGNSAFYDCSSLKAVNVPYTLTNLDRVFSRESLAILNAYEHDGRAMFSPDGKVVIVSPSQVEDYVNAGWYQVPVKALYSLDGRKIVVEKTQIKDYVNVGWYENIEDVQQYIYAPGGNSAIVYKSEVPSYTAVGWSTTPLAFKGSSALPITFTDSKNPINSLTIKDFYIREIKDHGNTKNVIFGIECTGLADFPIEFLSYDINGNLLETKEVDIDIFHYVYVPKATASLIIRAKTNGTNPVYCYNEYVTLFSSSGKSIYVPDLHSSAYYPEYTYGTIMYDKEGNEVEVNPSKVNSYINQGYYRDYYEYYYYEVFAPVFDRYLKNKKYDAAYAWALYYKNAFTKTSTVVESLFTESDLYTAKTLWQSNSNCPIGLIHSKVGIYSTGIIISFVAMPLSNKKIDTFTVACDTYIDGTFFKTLQCKVDESAYHTDNWLNDGHWGGNDISGWPIFATDIPRILEITDANNFRVVEVTFEDGTTWTPTI